MPDSKPQYVKAMVNAFTKDPYQNVSRQYSQNTNDQAGPPKIPTPTPQFAQSVAAAHGDAQTVARAGGVKVLGNFHTGGTVQKSGAYQLQKGERVIPRSVYALSKAMKKRGK